MGLGRCNRRGGPKNIYRKNRKRRQRRGPTGAVRDAATGGWCAVCSLVTIRLSGGKIHIRLVAHVDCVVCIAPTFLLSPNIYTSAEERSYGQLR